MPNIAHCIGCGCSDFAACEDERTGEPCHWLAVDYEAGRGVCSACPEEMARWAEGNRELAVPLDEDEDDILMDQEGGSAGM